MKAADLFYCMPPVVVLLLLHDVGMLDPDDPVNSVANNFLFLRSCWKHTNMFDCR